MSGLLLNLLAALLVGQYVLSDALAQQAAKVYRIGYVA